MNDLQHIKNFWQQHFQYKDVVEMIPKYKVVQLYRHLYQDSTITDDQLLKESGRIAVKTKKVHRTKEKYFLVKPISQRATHYLAGPPTINQQNTPPTPIHPQLHFIDTPMIPLTSKVTATTSQTETVGNPGLSPSTITHAQQHSTILQVYNRISFCVLTSFTTVPRYCLSSSSTNH